jgi:hypothetical protein
MSEQSGVGFDQLPILGELRGLLNEHYVRAVRHPHRRRPLRQRRWRPLALVAVLVLGGGTAALAAAGVFRSGPPYGGADYPLTATAGNGIVTSSSVHLLPVAVQDPAGGPPWGLRIDRTTRGLVCIVAGRRDYGTVGALGIDGAFHNDHLFHPLAVNSQEQSTCSSTDRAGNAFINVALQADALSGIQAQCRAESVSALRRSLPRAPGSLFGKYYASLPPCHLGQLRDIYYGLLGPDAISVTYPGPHGATLTEKTVGSDGAYLVVAPGTDQICQHYGIFGGTGCGIGGTNGSTAGMPAGFFDTVTYRNGKTCHVDRLQADQRRAAAAYQTELRQRFPLIVARQTGKHLTAEQTAEARHIVRSGAFRQFQRSKFLPLLAMPTCPVVGRVAPPSVHITSAQVAAPVHVTVGHFNPDCATRDGQHRCGFAEVNLTVSFKARVGVTNINSHDEVNAMETLTGPCRTGGGGTSAPTARDLRTGQTVTMMIEMSDCPSIVHGDIVFDARNNTAYKPQKVPSGLAAPDGVVVGTFTAQIH